MGENAAAEPASAAKATSLEVIAIFSRDCFVIKFQGRILEKGGLQKSFSSPTVA